MKIATITPTRGDRSQFVQNARKLIKLQTHQPDEVIIVDDVPRSDAFDINWRYHKGCHEAVKRGCNLLIFWEDDDYYAPRYIETMLNFYEKTDPKPLIVGIGDTIYYSIRLCKWNKFIHPGRASAMNTAMTTEACKKFPWPKDSPEGYDPQHGTNFLDRQLWSWAAQNKCGKTFATHIYSPVSIGIKHGIGKCGGSHHDTNEAAWLMPLRFSDADLSWLRRHVIPEIFPFYEKLAQQLKEKEREKKPHL